MRSFPRDFRTKSTPPLIAKSRLSAKEGSSINELRLLSSFSITGISKLTKLAKEGKKAPAFLKPGFAFLPH